MDGRLLTLLALAGIAGARAVRGSRGIVRATRQPPSEYVNVVLDVFLETDDEQNLVVRRSLIEMLDTMEHDLRVALSTSGNPSIIRRKINLRRDFLPILEQRIQRWMNESTYPISHFRLDPDPAYDKGSKGIVRRGGPRPSAPITWTGVDKDDWRYTDPSGQKWKIWQMANGEWSVVVAGREAGHAGTFPLAKALAEQMIQIGYVPRPSSMKGSKGIVRRGERRVPPDDRRLAAIQALQSWQLYFGKAGTNQGTVWSNDKKLASTPSDDATIGSFLGALQEAGLAATTIEQGSDIFRVAPTIQITTGDLVSWIKYNPRFRTAQIHLLSGRNLNFLVHEVYRFEDTLKLLAIVLECSFTRVTEPL